VAVIAPAGPFDRESFEAGIAVLRDRYQVQYESGVFATHRYLAGEDSRRLAELHDALTNPKIRGVFCARGGYGTLRLLARLAAADPLLEWTRQGRKPLVGFSDITALHQWHQRHGLVSIHGPVTTQLAKQPLPTRERLFSLLESRVPRETLRGTTTFVDGIAEGPLLGGNLSVLTRLLGTPFMPALDGAILLLEDLAERPYRLDRMWTHLELAGAFRNLGGIVLGTFNGCEERDATYTSTEILRDLARATGLPCAAGFPVGHGDINEPVALGVRVRLDAGSCTVRFLEPAAE